MNNRGIGFGVFLLTIGIVWVLANTGVISWSIVNAFFTLWPLLLVLIGVNVIFRNNELVKGAAWLLFLAVLVSYGYFVEDRPNDEKSAQDRRVTIEKYQETSLGNLKLELGASNIYLDKDTSNLLDADLSDSGIKYSEDYQDGKSIANLRFTRKEFIIGAHGINNRDYSFHLNDSIKWNMVLQTGAVKGNIDMSSLKVGNFELNLGAGNMKLIFGNKGDVTNAKVNAGASKVEVSVPESAGIKVKLDGALNDSNLDELGWQRDGNYFISPNYDRSESKINLDVSMGVGKFDIDVRK